MRFQLEPDASSTLIGVGHGSSFLVSMEVIMRTRLGISFTPFVQVSSLMALTLAISFGLAPAHASVGLANYGDQCIRGEPEVIKYMYFSRDDGSVFGHGQMLSGIHLAKLTDLSRFVLVKVRRETRSELPESDYIDRVKYGLEKVNGTWRLKNFASIDEDIFEFTRLDQFNPETGCILTRGSHISRLPKGRK
jgi:hypothetical protein